MTKRNAKKVIKFYQHHEVSTSRRYRASSGRTIQQEIGYVATSTLNAVDAPCKNDAVVESVFPDDLAPEVIEHQISGYTVVAKPKGDDPRKRYECTVSRSMISTGKNCMLI